MHLQEYKSKGTGVVSYSFSPVPCRGSCLLQLNKFLLGAWMDGQFYILPHCLVNFKIILTLTPNVPYISFQRSFLFLQTKHYSPAKVDDSVFPKFAPPVPIHLCALAHAVNSIWNTISTPLYICLSKSYLLSSSIINISFSIKPSS